MSIGKIGGIFGCGGAIINFVLCLFEKGIKPSQIIAFVNRWPVVILGICLCITYIVTECCRQENKTIRKNTGAERDKKYLDEEETKRKKMEQQLEEEKDKNRDKSIEIERLKAQKENIEKEKEVLKKENEVLKKEKEVLKRENEVLKSANKQVEEEEQPLEQNQNKTGGQGGSNIIHFNGRNGSNTE